MPRHGRYMHLRSRSAPREEKTEDPERRQCRRKEQLPRNEIVDWFYSPTLRRAWPPRRGPRGRHMRSRYRCSMCSAIHINSRSWLRSSSTHEPSDPPHTVVKMSFFPHAARRGGVSNGAPEGARQSLFFTQRVWGTRKSGFEKLAICTTQYTSAGPEHRALPGDFVESDRRAGSETLAKSGGGDPSDDPSPSGGV